MIYVYSNLVIVVHSFMKFKINLVTYLILMF